MLQSLNYSVAVDSWFKKKKYVRLRSGHENVFDLSFCLIGPDQTHPAMYPAPNYYAGARGYPSVPAQCPPVSSKAPLMNMDYSANYYHNSHSQPIATPGSGPGPYPTPPVSQNPAQPLSTTNPPVSGAPQYPPQSFQQPASYANYYGQHYSATVPGQQQQQQQQNLVPASSGTGPNNPFYPIVSYPSAPGSSQYGTLRSSQTAGQPPVTPVIPPPTQSALQQQYPQGNGATPTPAQQGYGAPPLNQTATVNGQSSAGM